MKKITLLCLLVPFMALGQNYMRCGSEIVKRHYQYSDQTYLERQEQLFSQAKQWAEANQRSIAQSEEVLQIPVVVHVLYENDAENLSDEIIKSQIDVLNEDYGRTNADTINTRAVFDTIAGKAKFQFYLATIDPLGNPTTGITRTPTNVSSFMTEAELYTGQLLESMKKPSSGGVAPWPVEDYMNIWVCDISFNGEIALLGYATPPNNLPNWEGDPLTAPEYDGVVIQYSVFGREAVEVMGNGQSVNFLGRVVTHETGHYLGLRHIWGDGPCGQVDGIDDTPDAYSSGMSQCDHNANTCYDSPYDFPDMVENYMDYSAPSCQNMFTKGQVDFMFSVIVNNRTELPDTIANSNPNSILKYSSELSVYPNPAKDRVTLNLSQLEETTELQIIDITGKVIWQSVYSIGSNQSQMNISTEAFSRGIYFLNARSRSSAYSQKIVFE